MELINGKSIKIKIKYDIDYENLIMGKRDTIMSILLWTGYLTPTNEINQLKIPNEAVR